MPKSFRDDEYSSSYTLPSDINALKILLRFIVFLTKKLSGLLIFILMDEFFGFIVTRQRRKY